MKTTSFVEDHRNNLNPGDTLYIVTISGINVRQEANAKSFILERIKLNDYVIYLEPTSKTEIIEDRRGKWIKIKTRNRTKGFIFSGYTSKVKFPENFECGKIVGFTDILGVDLNAPLSTQSFSLSGDLRDEKGRSSHIVNTYANGTTITQSIGYGWNNVTIESFLLSENDVINYLRYYLHSIEIKCLMYGPVPYRKILIEDTEWPSPHKSITVDPKSGLSFSYMRINDKSIVTIGTKSKYE